MQDQDRSCIGALIWRLSPCSNGRSVRRSFVRKVLPTAMMMLAGRPDFLDWRYPEGGDHDGDSDVEIVAHACPLPPPPYDPFDEAARAATTEGVVYEQRQEGRNTAQPGRTWFGHHHRPDVRRLDAEAACPRRMGLW